MYEEIISTELKLWQPKLEKLALDIWANPEKPNAEHKPCKWTAALLAEADIFLSNIRYGGLSRLGLDYASLHKRYPRLICSYINGYGFEGPEKDKAGFDMTSFWITALSKKLNKFQSFRKNATNMQKGTAHRPFPTIIFSFLGVVSLIFETTPFLFITGV